MFSDPGMALNKKRTETFFMKRSEINTYIAEAESFFAEHGFLRPGFSKWTPDDWKKQERSIPSGQIRQMDLSWSVKSLLSTMTIQTTVLRKSGNGFNKLQRMLLLID